MTRELKFRAWDKLSGRYYLDVLLEEGGAIKATERKGQPSWPRDFVWEQFTGLKDKNGREIYEGDIVRTDHGVPGVTIEQVEIVRDHLVGYLEYWEDGEVIGNTHENPELLKK